MNPRLINQLARGFQVLGDAHHDLQQNEDALRCFNRCLELTLKLPDNQPVTGETKGTLLTYAYERLGNHWLQVGLPDRSLKMFEKMKTLSQVESDKDPANRYLKGNLAMAFRKIADALHALGQREAAAASEREGDRIDRELMN